VINSIRRGRAAVVTPRMISSGSHFGTVSTTLAPSLSRR
jgi:hypothetical protein